MVITSGRIIAQDACFGNRREKAPRGAGQNDIDWKKNDCRTVISIKFGGVYGKLACSQRKRLRFRLNMNSCPSDLRPEIRED
jgi:hypothetical protein